APARLAQPHLGPAAEVLQARARRAFGDQDAQAHAARGGLLQRGDPAAAVGQHALRRDEGDLLRRAADQLVVALEGVAPAPEEGEAAAVAARGAAHQGERLQKLFALKAQAARRLLVLLLDLVQELGEGDGRVLARELGKDLDE